MAKGVSDNGRTFEQIERHYQIEKELASRLRNAGREERRKLYSEVYADAFRLMPDHPVLGQSTEDLTRRALRQIAFLKRFLNKDVVMLEIGAGRCELAFEAAKYAKKVYGLDVDEKVTEALPRPGNFEFILCDGLSIPLPEASVDVAYSNQMIEHLHPDDAFDQLKSIYRILAPGGVYVCGAPNRLSGPYDVSKWFDKVATGLHLKEYTSTELSELFKEVGFSRVSPYASVRFHHWKIPLLAVKACEGILSLLPYCLRRPLAGNLPLRAVLGVLLVGKK